MKKIILISLASMLMPLLASAQALPFIAANYDPATLAMGGASAVQTSSIAYSAFRNSATIPFSEQKFDAGATYGIWAPSAIKTNVMVASLAFNHKQKLGLAAGFAYGMNPAYDLTDASGSSVGQFKPSEMQLNAGFSYRFISFLSAGVNVGYASSKLAEGASYGAFNADVFLMAKFSGLKLTAGISDIGTAVTSASGQKYSLPTAGTLGLGYQANIKEKHAIDIQADADYYFAGAFSAALGASYTFNDLLSVRAGYRAGAKAVIPSFISLGAGVKVFGLKLDVAYLLGAGSSALSNTLAVSLGYSF